MIRSNQSLPIIAVTAVFLCGCDGKRNREDDANIQVIAKPCTTKEDAVAIAKTEAEKRHWPGVEVQSVRFEGTNWVVRLERTPQSYGGFSTVFIGTNGQVTYIPGL